MINFKYSTMNINKYKQWNIDELDNEYKHSIFVCRDNKENVIIIIYTFTILNVSCANIIYYTKIRKKTKSARAEIKQNRTHTWRL